MSIDEMVDLTNIGTLFAFVLVCVGIIILRYKDPDRERPFRVPSNAWWTLLPLLTLFLVLFYLPNLLGPQFTIFGREVSLPTFMLSNTWRYVEPPVFIVLASSLLVVYPRSKFGKRLPIGAWSLPLLGAASCIFLMVYLPPASWWRFVAWLMLGLSVYLSYGYVRSGIGRRANRPLTTPPWLAMMAVGSFLVAVGLLTMPHDAGFHDLVQQLQAGFAEGKRTIIAFGCMGLGVALGLIGAVIGAMQKGGSAASSN
jgi:hypothetical protein